jgi:outer membrane protein assembly complex protein YaeT
MTKISWYFLLLVLIFTLAPLKGIAVESTGLTINDQRFSKELLKGKSNPSISDIDTALQKIFLSGNYENLSATQLPNSQWKIEAQSTKKLREIKVIGAVSISEDTVREQLGLKSGSPLSRESILSGGQNLKEYLAKRSFLGAEVTLRALPVLSPHRAKEETSLSGGGDIGDTDLVDLEVKIHEGRPTRISTVKIVSANRDLVKKITNLSKSLIGQNFDESLILAFQENASNYLSENRFLTASFRGPDVQFSSQKESVDLTFSIERPYKFVVLFWGNQHFTVSDLRRLVQKDSDVLLGSNPVPVLTNRIIELYKNTGFPYIKVESKETLTASNFERVVNFQIEEGFRAKITSFVVQNRNSEKSEEFKKRVLAHGSDLLKSNYYNQQDLEVAAQKLIAELENEGYLKARVQSISDQPQNGGRAISVKLVIDEGPQTLVQKITFDGLDNFENEKALAQLGLVEGKPLSLVELEAGLERIETMMHNEGYLDAHIKNRTSELVQYFNDNSRAKLNIKIHEGPKVTVGTIAISGNEITDSFVIARELDFAVGDTLTPQRLANSQFQLQGTGLFARVDITMLERGSENPKRTIAIQVEERDPGVFTFGTGVNNEFNLTVRGFLGLSYRNLGGTARGVSSRVELRRVTDINVLEHSASMGYYEPFIFDSRTRGRVNLTNSKSIFSRNSSDGLVVLEDTTELNFNLENELTRQVKATWNLWNLEISRRYEEEEGTTIEGQNIGSIGPAIEGDFRDDLFQPTKGIYTQFSADFADPNLGSTNEIRFLRLNAGFNFYIPIFSKDWVFANSLKGGYMTNLNRGTSEVPESKSFFLGGRSTIRGFDPRSIPNKSDLVEDTTTPLTVPESSHYYLVKSEIRFPISGIVGGVLFYDGGAVLIQGVEIENAYRDAAGLGIRFNTPVGPLSVEYGYKLDRDPSKESEGRLHISIGAF